jgi:hypothetical protein
MDFYQSRTIAYELAKRLGDASAITGERVGGKTRGALYSGAKSLGDLNALSGKARVSGAGGGIGGRLEARAFSIPGRNLSALTNQLPPFAARLLNRHVGQKLQAKRSALSTPKKKSYLAINPKGIEQLLENPEIQKLLIRKAETFQKNLQQSLPKKTGEYANSWKIDFVKMTPQGYPMVIIFTDQWQKGKFIEYGTKNMGPNPVIRQNLGKLKDM